MRLAGIGMERYRRLQRDESGSELVEFALTCVVLVLLVFGIIECSLALYANHFVSYAASEGARYAMVRGSSWTGTPCNGSTTGVTCQASSDDVQTYVQSLAPGGITKGSVQVTATPSPLASGGTGCAAPDPGCVVTVDVKYPFTLQIPFVPVQVIHLESSAAMVVSQ